MAKLMFCPRCEGDGRLPGEPRCSLCNGMRLILADDTAVADGSEQ